MDGRWEVPGGKCERGETHCQALKREFIEEFRISIACGGFLGAQEFTNHGQPYRVYGYRIRPAAPVRDLREHERVQWYSLSALRDLVENSPDLVVDSDRGLLEKLIGETEFRALFQNLD